MSDRSSWSQGFPTTKLPTIALVLIALATSLLGARADLLRGQVTQIITGTPIAGAKVELYSDPMGAPDFTLTTGPLGLYESPDPIATTTYEARVSRPGYITSISSFTMDSNPKVENFELIPAAGTP